MITKDENEIEKEGKPEKEQPEQIWADLQKKRALQAQNESELYSSGSPSSGEDQFMETQATGSDRLDPLKDLAGTSGLFSESKFDRYSKMSTDQLLHLLTKDDHEIYRLKKEFKNNPDLEKLFRSEMIKKLCSFYPFR